MPTATVHGAAHTPFHLPPRLAYAAEWAVNTVKLWRRRSRERTELARWEDRDLRDAAISRAILEIERTKPFWRG